MASRAGFKACAGITTLVESWLRMPSQGSRSSCSPCCPGCRRRGRQGNFFEGAIRAKREQTAVIFQQNHAFSGRFAGCLRRYQVFQGSLRGVGIQLAEGVVKKSELSEPSARLASILRLGYTFISSILVRAGKYRRPYPYHCQRGILRKHLRHFLPHHVPCSPKEFQSLTTIPFQAHSPRRISVIKCLFMLAGTPFSVLKSISDVCAPALAAASRQRHFRSRSRSYQLYCSHTSVNPYTAKYLGTSGQCR